MHDDEVADEEPAEDQGSTETPKGRPSFRRIRRELTEDELKSAGVQKLLLDETERLENECASLRLYLDRYHTADKERAILLEKLKPQTAVDFFTTAAVAVGSLMIGYAPGAWAQQPTGWLALVFGGLLAAAGLVAKRVSK